MKKFSDLILEFTRVDSQKLDKFLKSIEKLKDKEVVSQINKSVAVLQTDPYCNYLEILGFLEMRWKNNQEILEIIKANKNN